MVGLVPSVLSGGASASALRLSIGSGADSWRNGSGALRPCVRADSARLRCAFFERRPMGIRKSVCNDGRNSSAWSVGPGTIEVRMNWGARGRSGWLPCALAQPTACEHTVGTARGAEHKKGSSALQYDWGRPGTAAVCVHTVGSSVSGLVKVGCVAVPYRSTGGFLGEVSDPCERGVDEFGEECGELCGLVSFLFGFIGVRAGSMAYYTWVSMGASMPGAACFLSLRVCALAWLG